MLSLFLTFLSQEPPVPTPEETPPFGPTPLLYVAIVIAVAAIIAWKYKAILEFIIILCCTIGGFIVGFVATPPRGNVGLGMMVATAGLMFSIAIVIVLRLIQKSR